MTDSSHIEELAEAYQVKMEPGTLRISADLPPTANARRFLHALEMVAIAYDDSSLPGAEEQAESFRSFQQTLTAYLMSETEYIRYVGAAFDVALEILKETDGHIEEIAAITSALHTLNKELAELGPDDIEQEYISFTVRISGPRSLIRTAALAMSGIVTTTIFAIKAACEKAKLSERPDCALSDDAFKVQYFSESEVPALRVPRRIPPFPCTEEADKLFYPSEEQ